MINYPTCKDLKDCLPNIYLQNKLMIPATMYILHCSFMLKCESHAICVLSLLLSWMVEGFSFDLGGSYASNLYLAQYVFIIVVSS